MFVRMVAELGPAYTTYAAEVLRGALPDKGYTAQVLGYTLHALLEALSRVRLPGSTLKSASLNHDRSAPRPSSRSTACLRCGIGAEGHLPGSKKETPRKKKILPFRSIESFIGIVCVERLCQDQDQRPKQQSCGMLLAVSAQSRSLVFSCLATDQAASRQQPSCCCFCCCCHSVHCGGNARDSTRQSEGTLWGCQWAMPTSYDSGTVAVT